MPALNFDKSMLQTDEGLLDNIIIEMETIDDTWEKSIAKYDYPYADGVDTEDMGIKSHGIRFRCYFYDNEANQSYDTHSLLLKNLESRNNHDFVHPKYGMIKGKIETIVVQHNDDIRKAIIDLTFIEDGYRAVDVQPPANVASALADAYQSAQDQQQSAFAAALKSIGIDPAAVSQTLDKGKTMLEQAQNYAAKTRTIVAQVEKYIATGESIVAQIESPLNSLQATITYGSTISGRVVGGLSGILEKVARTCDSLKNAPALYINKLNAELDGLTQSFADMNKSATSAVATAAGDVMLDHLLITGAQRLALEAADIYSADNEAANDTSGDTDVQPMNIDELEATLAVVRTRLEAAINISRDMDSLKKMAESLLVYVNTVRLEREAMTTVTLDNPMPLHLVCLKYGLPISDAKRLVRINRISNPNYASGEIKIYVRQS